MSKYRIERFLGNARECTPLVLEEDNQDNSDVESEASDTSDELAAIIEDAVTLITGPLYHWLLVSIRKHLSPAYQSNSSKPEQEIVRYLRSVLATGRGDIEMIDSRDLYARTTCIERATSWIEQTFNVSLELWPLRPTPRPAPAGFATAKWHCVSLIVPVSTVQVP